MRRASRASASSASRAAACSGATSVSGQATTTLATRSSLRTARSTRAARLATAPARISMGRSVRRRRARARPATAWARHPGAAAAWAAAAHSAALASSAQMMSTRRPTPGPSPGVSGVINLHSSAACSTAGGRTSTTGRPRSSAAFASATVTRSSVVKGRLVWGMVRSGGRKGNGCVARLPVAILSPMSPASGFSPNLQHLETSATIAISQEAKRRKAAGEDVIDLGAGEPDFPTPSIPADAGVRAIRGGKTHYPANEGILELRAAAAKHLSLLSGGRPVNAARGSPRRSEEHTSELQSHHDLVCRLLLEKKKYKEMKASRTKAEETLASTTHGDTLQQIANPSRPRSNLTAHRPKSRADT